MADDINYEDDDYEMEDMDSMFGELDGGEARQPPSSKREAVEYAATDIKDGLKEGFSKAELKNNITELTKNLSPKVLANEDRQINTIKDSLTSEARKVVDENKDNIKSISGFVKSKTAEGGILNRLASSVEESLGINDSTAIEESLESIAQRTIDGQLETAMEEMNSERLNAITSYNTQEAMNRVYGTLLKQEVFDKSITSKFYRKSLEYQFMQLTTTRKSLDILASGFNRLENSLSYVVKNTGLPDVIKMKSTEAVQAQARNRIVDNAFNNIAGSGWVKNVRQKISNKMSGVKSGLGAAASGVEQYKATQEMNEMMAEMGAGSSTKMFASTIPGMLMGFLGGQIGNKLSRTVYGRKTVDAVKDLAYDPSSTLRDVADNMATDGSNPFVNFIKSKTSKGLRGIADFIGSDIDKTGIPLDLNNDDLTSAATIDNKTLITQNEVVPGLLSKILSEVHMIRTGKTEKESPELKYNYETRMFETVDKMSTDFTRRISRLIKGTGGAENITGIAKFVLNNSGVPYDDLVLAKVKNGLTSFMLSGKTFRVEKLNSDFYSYFDPEVGTMFASGINNLINSSNPDATSNKAALRDSLDRAKESIPNIDGIINRQIELGNLDVLQKTGYVDFDVATGKYKTNSKAFSKELESAYKQYQGNGNQITPEDIFEGKTIFDMSYYMDKSDTLSDFKARVEKNATNDDRFIRAVDNKPLDKTTFTINRSGTNSISEQYATKMYVKSRPIIKSVSDKMYEFADEVSSKAKNTETYKFIESHLKDLGIELKLDKDTLTLVSRMRAGLNSALKGFSGKAVDLDYKSRVYILDFLLEEGKISTAEYATSLDKLNDLYINTKEKIDNTDYVKNVEDTVRNINNNITSNDVIKDLKKGEFKKAGGEVYSKTKSAVSEALDAAEDKVEKFSESDIYKKMEDKIQENKEKVTNKVSEIYGDVSKMTIRDEAISKFSNLRDSTIKALEDMDLTSLKGIDISKSFDIVKDNIFSMLDVLDLDMPNLKLDNKTMLELYTVLTTTPPEEARLAVLTYLHSKELVSDQFLHNSIAKFNELKEALNEKKEELKDGIEKRRADFIINASGIAVEIRNTDANKKIINALNSVIESRFIQDVNYTRKNPEPEEMEDAEIETDDDLMTDAERQQMEDKRTGTIITRILDKLGFKEKKNKANDSDGDGLRDGSWRSMFSKKPKNGKEEDMDKVMKSDTKEKSGGILGMILKVLGFGFPLLVNYFKGVASTVGSIVKLLANIPMLPSLIGGVTKGIFNLGKFIVTGLSGVLLKYGKGVGSVTGGIGKGVMKNKGKWWSKAGTVAKYGGKLVRKLPVIGALAGAGYAAHQLINGDGIGAFGTMASGLAAAIPLVGTAASFGIDYLTDMYKERNPSIDKELYESKEFPDVSIEALDKITLDHIRKQETGSAKGKYAIAKDIGDGAGISFGTYQFTEKSGNLKEYIRRMAELSNDPVAKSILENFNGNMYGGSKTGLIKYLKATGDTQLGRYVQDTMYKELFMEPAKNLARQYGITDKAAISQVIDHSVNAGLGGVKRMLYFAGGNYSAESIARARKQHYNTIITGNRKLGRYREIWFRRVDENAKAFMSYSDEKEKDTKVASNDKPTTKTKTRSRTLETKTTIVDKPSIVDDVENKISNPITNKPIIVKDRQPATRTSRTTELLTSYVKQSTDFNKAILEKPSTIVDFSKLEEKINASNEHLSSIDTSNKAIAPSIEEVAKAISALSKHLEEIKKAVEKQSENNPAMISHRPVPLNKGVSLR